MHLLFGDHKAVRLKGIDPPEIRGQCEAEKRRAIEARDFLQSRLRAASRIDLLHAKRGKYFRVVGVVIADGFVQLLRDGRSGVRFICLTYDTVAFQHNTPII